MSFSSRPHQPVGQRRTAFVSTLIAAAWLAASALPALGQPVGPLDERALPFMPGSRLIPVPTIDPVQARAADTTDADSPGDRVDAATEELDADGVTAPGLPDDPVRALSSACTTVNIEWVWDAEVETPSHPHVCSSPVIVQLTDDNGDGAINECDDPDVVFTHFNNVSFLQAQLTALDGATGVTIWTQDAVDVNVEPLAAGDVDGDGIVEIVASQWSDGAILIFDHEGNVQATGTPSIIGVFESIGIADFEQDGVPEYYSGSQIFNNDGTLRCTGVLGYAAAGAGRLSIAADINPVNPGLELVTGQTAYDADCNVVWDRGPGTDGYPTLGDFNDDGQPDMFVVVGNTYRIIDAVTGLELVATPSAGFGFSWTPPLAVELDGTAGAEIAVCDGTSIRGLNWDGVGAITELWSAPVNDSSSQNSLSAFDFDGDGIDDIVFHDENDVLVVDGATGAFNMQEPFNTATGTELTPVADIDGDGKAEIVATGCLGGFSFPDTNKVIAYECDTAEPARPIWNQFPYHFDNVEEDGGIPQVEVQSWTTHNTWGAQREPVGPPVCEVGEGCAPRNHGYWHRYCLGTGLIEPGRFGQGEGPGVSPQHVDLPVGLPALVDGKMAPHGILGCQALDEGPFSDELLAALRELATLHFNLGSGYLNLTCPVELHPVELGEGLIVADALTFMEDRIAAGDVDSLKEARWIGEHVNNGEALIRQ